MRFQQPAVKFLNSRTDALEEPTCICSYRSRGRIKQMHFEITYIPPSPEKPVKDLTDQMGNYSHERHILGNRRLKESSKEWQEGREPRSGAMSQVWWSGRVLPLDSALLPQIPMWKLQGPASQIPLHLETKSLKRQIRKNKVSKVSPDLMTDILERSELESVSASRHLSLSQHIIKEREGGIEWQERCSRIQKSKWRQWGTSHLQKPIFVNSIFPSIQNYEK